MTSPFDEAKYRALLEGLEIAVVTQSQLFLENPTNRIDSEFLSKGAITSFELMSLSANQHLKNLVARIQHPTELTRSYAESGLHVILAQNVRNNLLSISEKSFMPLSVKDLLAPNLLEYDDVLMTRSGANFGQTACWKFYNEAYACADLLVFRQPKCAGGYLSTFFNTRYGKALVERGCYGMAQPHIAPNYLGMVRVPRFGSIEKRIDEFVVQAYKYLANSTDCYQKAEQTLLRTLGLEGWQPPEALTYERKAADVFAAGRLDAEHFQEKYFAARRELKKAGAIRFIHLNDMLADLANGHTPLHHDLSIGELPFLCAEHINNFVISYGSEKRILEKHHNTELSRTALRKGDVLMTIKGKVGNMALVEDLIGPVNINQDVALLRIRETFPLWYVLAFVNSRFGNMFSQQLSTGGINPFLGLSNVRLLEIPQFDDNTMLTIANETKEYVHKARHAYKQAHYLLDQAKRAVEIAIEENEETAMKFLKQSQGV